MATISLCMIVRDEAPVLARCLDCVKSVMDEIIIIDTGSQDTTKQIASQYTDKIYDFVWNDHFAEARNFAFSKASCEYQMWLDADDVITPENQKKLFGLKQNLSADVVMMPYHVAFDADQNPVYTYYRERILKRSLNFQWQGAVHEAITPSGTILYSDIAIEHRKLYSNDPDRNLRIFEKLLSEHQILSARDLFYYANELYYHKKYEKAIKNYLDFLHHPDAWKDNLIDACQKLSACYLAQHDTESALRILFHSFLYDRPRAEICCDIGKIFMNQKNYQTAVFWYQSALEAPFPDENGGFSVPDCHDYIPYMQLCVCYDRMGNISKARSYNNRAGRIKPNDAGFLYNQNYFREILKKERDR